MTKPLLNRCISFSTLALCFAVLPIQADTGLGFEAFKGATKLKSITLPANTKGVDADAFADCPALETIVLTPAKLEALTMGAFPDQKGLTIYVPDQQDVHDLTQMYQFAHTQVKVGSPAAISETAVNQAVTITTIPNGISVSADQPTTVQIYNISGQEVASAQLAAGATEQLTISAGTYILKVGEIVRKIQIR